jgi:PhnB protein
MQVQPYLSFEGRAEEAIEFYKKAVGAEVQMLMRFKDAPPPPPSDAPGGCGHPTAGTEHKVMHATLKIGESMVHLSDGRCHGASKFEGISLSLAVDNDAQAERAFAALSEGGTPLNDRFGVMWMVMAGPNK